MKYFAYNRKSTDEAGNQILSLDTQKTITDDIALRHGLEVIETIQEARSAKIAGNRPLFTSMIARIRDGEAEGIIVAHLDRLARNERELADLIELRQDNKLKEVRTKDKTYDSVDDMYYMGIDLIGAAQFSRKLAVRVKEGIQTKLKRGEFPTRAPIGYTNKDAKIYPDPTYQDYIKLAFTLYAEGMYSLKDVTNILYERGMRSRDAGNKVNKSVVHEILSSPVYYGAIRSGGNLYKGIHEPLISKNLFDTVQDVLHGKNKPKKHTRDYMYRGYLKCGVCGCSLTADTKKGKYTYYYCTNAKGVCTQHKNYIPEGEVTKKLPEVFKPFTALKGEFAVLAYDQYVHDLLNDETSTRDNTALQLQEIDKKLERLLDLYLSGSLDEQLYNVKRKKLSGDRVQLELQMKSQKPFDPELTFEQLELLKQRALSSYTMFVEGDDLVRSDLLKSALSNSEWIDGSITSQQYKPLWEILEKGLKSGDISTMYPQSDSNRRFVP